MLFVVNVYLRNAMLVTEIFCYQYSTIFITPLKNDIFNKMWRSFQQFVQN